MTHPTQEDDVKAIRDALALGPTLGEWKSSGAPYNGHDDPCIYVDDGSEFGIYIAQTVYDMQSGTQEHNVDADTAFIAAANPERLTRLLARLEQAERDAGRWQEVIRHVGAVRHLGFAHFTLNTLHPAPGTNPMQGAVCQHFTAAIDAHIAAIASEAKT